MVFLNFRFKYTKIEYNNIAQPKQSNRILVALLS